MRINYPKRSKFLKKCEDCIRQNKEALLTGALIPLDFSEFSKPGYKGNICVTIEKTDYDSFRTDWEYSDPTRFPARIKAAAHALFIHDCFGKFVISHNAGILKIHLDSVVDNSKSIKQEHKPSKTQDNERHDNKYLHNTSSKSGKYNLDKDVERCAIVAEILYKQFNEPDKGIFGHTEMPEELLPDGIKKGSYEHLMFITLTVSIDYQRDAPKLWAATRQTISDIDTCWIYSPKEVHKRSDNELINAMQKHKLSKKPTKDSLEIWKSVSNSFYDLFNSDPRNLLKENNYDALKVFQLMNSKYKSNFPFLSGKKILPLWIRMMHDVVEIDLKNLDKIPIPIDIHVARATFCVGALKGNYIGSIQDVFDKIDEVWKDACKSLPYYRLQLDEPLWHLSKYGCTNRNQQ